MNLGEPCTLDGKSVVDFASFVRSTIADRPEKGKDPMGRVRLVKAVAFFLRLSYNYNNET